MGDEIQNVDKNLAFILELIGGFFGILGIGHMYSGLITGGVVRLIAWLGIVVFSWMVIFILSMFVIGLCLIPFMLVAQIGVPLWSAFSIRKKLEEAFPE